MLSVNPSQFIYSPTYLPERLNCLVVQALKFCMGCLSERRAHSVPIIKGSVEEVNTQEKGCDQRGKYVYTCI